MSSRVVHFEIPSAEPENAIKFFSEVFNWQFQKFGNEEYWMAITGEDGTPGINGAVMKKRDPAQPIVNSISVANIDSILGKIAKSGGTVVVPKMVVPGVGYSAYFKDPDGNIHGVWQEDAGAK